MITYQDGKKTERRSFQQDGQHVEEDYENDVLIRKTVNGVARELPASSSGRLKN